MKIGIKSTEKKNRQKLAISYVFDHVKYDYEKKIQKKFAVVVLKWNSLTILTSPKLIRKKSSLTSIPISFQRFLYSSSRSQCLKMNTHSKNSTILNNRVSYVHFDFGAQNLRSLQTKILHKLILYKLIFIFLHFYLIT